MVDQSPHRDKLTILTMRQTRDVRVQLQEKDLPVPGRGLWHFGDWRGSLVRLGKRDNNFSESRYRILDIAGGLRSKLSVDLFNGLVLDSLNFRVRSAQ